MGESAAETVKEIETTRDRLSRDLDELGDRLPGLGPAARRAIRMALGGGITGATFWFLMGGLRRRRNRREAIQAVVEPMRVSVQLLPERWIRAVESEAFRTWVLAAGSAWVVLKLLELRRLRRLEEALVTRTAQPF